MRVWKPATQFQEHIRPLRFWAFRQCFLFSVLGARYSSEGFWVQIVNCAYYALSFMGTSHHFNDSSLVARIVGIGELVNIYFCSVPRFTTQQVFEKLCESVYYEL